MSKVLDAKQSEAKISKRICAYLIDIIVIYLILSLVMMIKFINPYYEKYISYYDKVSEAYTAYYDEKTLSEEEYLDIYNESSYKMAKYGVSYQIVLVAGIILYFGVFQKFNNGQTIGKKIMKLKVVSNDGSKPSIGSFILRILPMYYVYIGGLLPVVVNSILVFILKQSAYITASLWVSYIFLGIALGSFILMFTRQDKKGLQDIIAKTKVISE